MTDPTNLTDLTIPYGGRTALTLTVRVPLSHVCPVVHERDFGRVTITYKPATRLLELHALAGLLRGYDDLEVTHEDLTADLHRVLAGALRPEGLTVTTSWTTAGLEYEVTVEG